ncbi:1-acyl-sn-glycerol-3-phosphate acyltransferase [Ketobacter sp. MCCC 1A13808]|uniref:lysophospholipid acyltransferase family protein n=1 Tax=Ketobacter sp. MCCC 1A13808 TaxID=2602738 RepID=UPI0012EB288D|nr:lysophospholipid acyltransferase family protein [Ketobacter sp. MCCC 1A13808]MVF12564.1 1-acyl-sn-glycerol-3-phosphate acyltransferase [Ketobacter sp. MCCC 1A13808]
MVRYIRATRLILHILLALFLLVITGSLWNSNTRLVKKTTRWWLNKTTRIIGVEIHVSGTIPEHKANSGILYISNHISWLDIPVIGGLESLNFLSKAEVQKWPLIGKLAEGTGTLFIRRGTGDADTISGKMADYLTQGRSVLFFPEGTTSDGSKVKRFHSKLFRVTQHTPAPLCPIAIHYSVEGEPGNPAAFIGDDEFTTHLWKLLGYPTITVNVQFLPLRNMDDGTLEASVRILRDEISETVIRLNEKTNTNSRSLGASTHGDQSARATSC